LLTVWIAFLNIANWENHITKDINKISIDENLKEYHVIALKKYSLFRIIEKIHNIIIITNKLRTDRG
jgi:hypothetical protein